MFPFVYTEVSSWNARYISGRLSIMPSVYVCRVARFLSTLQREASTL